MSELHPTDEQLFLYADGEPSREVEAHLRACADCRGAVDAAAAGRHALRSAPLLELPAARREAILAALPRRGRPPRPGRRFLGVAVPLAAVAAAVAVAALTGDTDPERVAEEMAAQDAQRDAPAAMEAAPAEGRAALPRVAGPPEEVAAALRARGLDARVVAGAVEVRGATRAQVEEALRDRAPGDVEVRLGP
ncbi:MAG TPA: hypothetical protein VM290_01580 [Gaiellaceae bacterium]|nr:hypothetical protein [Gaiellaceae bacterium]